VTEPTFLALQGIEELLRTRELVRAHYNPRLELAGVIVNRVERTVEHRESLAAVSGYLDKLLAAAPTLRVAIAS
jgi:cellulose biosynthesis protein BcsQ